MQQPNNIKPIGIIVPCYNHGKYIKECVDSILNQDYPHKAICIVDNGSGDNSWQTIQDNYPGEKIKINNTEFIVDNNPKCPIISTTFQARLGAAGGRNVGISALYNNVENFFFLDADDVLLDKSILSTMTSVLETYQEVGLVYGDYLVKDEKTQNIWREHKETYSLNGLQRDCYINSPLIRKKAFELVGMFDDSLDGQEDYDMWIRISERYMCYHIAEPTICARQHEDSTYNRVSMNKYHKGLQRIAEKMQERRAG